MLRRMLTLGALALVAVAFGVGTASADPGHTGGQRGHMHNQGFSDGRFSD